MTRSLRRFAALLIALLLPVQVAAWSCAQVCAVAPQAAMGEMAGHDDCDRGEATAGSDRCCQAQACLAVEVPVVVAGSPASFERDARVARWTSFFPDEPSPPPIAARRIA